jgi:protein-S-isoprenylcysteine O-methyltransferase Ste14
VKAIVGSPRDVVRRATLLVCGIAVLAANSALFAALWFAASRLAYVLFVGLSLSAESRRGALSARGGPEAAWARFRRRAEWAMENDAVAFGALCVVTRGDFAPPGPAWLATLAGLALVAVGVSAKVWATWSLPAGTFFWRDFFLPAERRAVSVAGPYRWVSAPMYTVGYAHAYGIALVLRSGVGLAAAVFAQAMVLLLHALVERPHMRRGRER